jgi:hypothetical protein
MVQTHDTQKRIVPEQARRMLCSYNGKNKGKAASSRRTTKLSAHYFAFFLGAGVFDFLGFGMAELL